MQLLFNGGGSHFPDLSLYNQAYWLTYTNLLTCISYWDCSFQLDYPSWPILEASSCVFLFKLNAIEYIYAKIYPVSPAASAVRKLWWVMSWQYQFDLFAEINVSVQVRSKIVKKSFLLKAWTERETYFGQINRLWQWFFVIFFSWDLDMICKLFLNGNIYKYNICWSLNMAL